MFIEVKLKSKIYNFANMRHLKSDAGGNEKVLFQIHGNIGNWINL